MGIAMFVGTHSISIIAPSWRDRCAERLGWRWRILCGVVSLLGIGLIVFGIREARQNPIVIYVAPYWMRRVTDVLMLPVLPLLLAAYLPGRIKTKLKHPMMIGIMVWATAHLLVNGMLADMVLFGSAFVWALWQRLFLGSRAAVTLMRAAPPSPYNDLVAIVVGVSAYAYVVFWAHALVIGRSPL